MLSTCPFRLVCIDKITASYVQTKGDDKINKEDNKVLKVSDFHVYGGIHCPELSVSGTEKNVLPEIDSNKTIQVITGTNGGVFALKVPKGVTTT